jgi:SAM-dependent methyltransferase
VNERRWRAYLAGFHTERPGITEHVLRHARVDGGDAYDWLAAAVPAGTLVLDLACGSAPLWTRLPCRDYLGVDVNTAELAAACRRGVRRLAQADAAALPLPDHSVQTVTCSMALHVLAPLPDVAVEIGRVLRPGGRLVATLPARGPLRTTDLPVLAGLLATLGRGLGYPNDGPLRQLPSLLAAAGLRPISDERRRFPYRLHSSADADRFLASLYLPDLPLLRYRLARRYLHTLIPARISLPVPIRRLVAVRV